MPTTNEFFEQDLLMVAGVVTHELNLFNETVARGNRLVTVYGDEKIIALMATPHDDDSKMAKLRMRTKEMAAEWDNVPVGFSEIENCRQLLTTMKQATDKKLRENYLWYLNKQVQDVIGERIKTSEIVVPKKTNKRKKKTFLYKIELENGISLILTLVSDYETFKCPHDQAEIFLLMGTDGELIGPPMTLDNCIILIVNMAMQTDRRVIDFLYEAQRYRGTAIISSSYRTCDESLDETKAIFPNQYALKFQIKNNHLLLNVCGIYNKQAYDIGTVECETMDQVKENIQSVASQDVFMPGELK